MKLIEVLRKESIGQLMAKLHQTLSRLRSDSSLWGCSTMCIDIEDRNHNRSPLIRPWRISSSSGSIIPQYPTRANSRWSLVICLPPCCNFITQVIVSHSHFAYSLSGSYRDIIFPQYVYCACHCAYISFTIHALPTPCWWHKQSWPLENPQVPIVPKLRLK